MVVQELPHHKRRRNKSEHQCKYRSKRISRSIELRRMQHENRDLKKGLPLLVVAFAASTHPTRGQRSQSHFPCRLIRQLLQRRVARVSGFLVGIVAFGVVTTDER